MSRKARPTLGDRLRKGARSQGTCAEALGKLAAEVLPMYSCPTNSVRRLALGALVAFSLLAAPSHSTAEEDGHTPVAEKPPVVKQPAAKQPASAATHTVELPREAFSAVVPTRWTVNQYGESVLSVSLGDAQMWVYEGDDEARAERQLERFIERHNGSHEKKDHTRAERFRAEGAELALQAWYVEGKEHRVMAIVKRIDGAAYHVEGRAPIGSKSAVDEMRSIIESINLTPYESSTRHVDWKDKWTMDVPTTWEIDASEDGTAKFTAPDGGQCTIRVLPVESAQAGETPEEVEQRALTMIDDAVARLLKRSITLIREGELERGVQKMAHGPAGSTLRANYVGSGKFKGKIRLGIECVVIDGVGALLAWNADQAKVAEAARAITRTLRRGTHPGARVDRVARRRVTKFPATYGPALRFVLPDLWSFTPPASKMRLGQIQIPGQPALWGTVFWFGEGQGGGKDPNMTRWKGQMGGDQPTYAESTLKIGNGIVAHTLKATGTFQAAVQQGGKERQNKPDHCLLATFVECPRGPIMIKFVGPKRVVSAMEADYEAWLRTFTVAGNDGAEKKDANKPASGTDTPDNGKKEKGKKEKGKKDAGKNPAPK